jgi:hypothetical protein
VKLALSALFAVALVVFGGRVARAQSAPQMQSAVDSNVVEVGGTLTLQLQATTSDVAPTDADPGATPGFVVRGQSTMPSRMTSIINGVRNDRISVTATWQLQAKKVGTFRLGPPTVAYQGSRYAGSSVTVKVVPAGQGPRRPQDPFGSFSPFDPWKGLVQQPPDPTPEPEVTADPKFGLDAARGTYAFLHAAVDKTSAVVGEQVTLTIYLYIDASAADAISLDDPHDATADDFVRHSIVSDDSFSKHVAYAQAGGKLWSVRVASRWALFPLKTGHLALGGMSLRLARPRMSGSPVRTSETLHVDVTEPPVAGRPPGYVVGDVGRFQMAATVAPREIEQDGAIAVNVELSGTGNLPSTLTPPARRGIEWLDPTTRESLGAQSGNAWGGTRSFDFVVRLHDAGTIDLGSLSLPYWDPVARAYAVAQAPLGAVTVKPVAGRAAASADAKVELLTGLPGMRAGLEGARPARTYWTDSPLFFGGLLVSPLAYVMAIGATSVVARVRRRSKARAESPETELATRVRSAETAAKGGDGRALDAAVTHVIEAATLARSGVRVRGAREDEAESRLADAGVPTEVAHEVGELLRACEAARFSPDETSIDEARGRWTRARTAIGKLGATA